MTSASPTRSVPLFVAIIGLGLCVASHVSTQRRMASLEAALRVGLEARDAHVDEAPRAVVASSTAPASVDLPALLTACRDEATRAPSGVSAVGNEGADEQEPEHVTDARIEADGVFDRALASGRFTGEDAALLRDAFTRLPGSDIARISVAFADAVNRRQIVPDEPLPL